MKKTFSLLMAVVFIALAFVSCGGDTSDTPGATTVTNAPSSTTASVTTADPEPEPEPFYANEIIKNGASEYVIVHEGTAASRSLATRIVNMVKAAFGVTLEVTSAKDKTEGDYEIVLGTARSVADKTYEKLGSMFDFAVRAEDKKLVICANSDESTLYLAEYLAREVFVKSEDNSFVFDTDDNIVYSESSLFEKNYIEYMNEAKKSITLGNIFSSGVYKNSDTSLPYRLYVPANYTPDKEYPIFVNLHGAGHRGNDNDKHLGFIGSLLTVNDLPLDEAIIIFPQCPADNKWVDTDWGLGSYDLDAVPESNELRALVELIGEIKKNYSVDEKRVYACGLSMGGYGVWNLLMRHSDIFTAGVAMCGAGDPTEADVLVDIPVWAIHGAKDPTVPVSGSREMVNAIKAAGGTKVQYTELPNNQHDVWTYTYANYNIFIWLFEQVKA